MMIDKNFRGHILVYKDGNIIGCVQELDTDTKLMKHYSGEDVYKSVTVPGFELPEPMVSSYDALIFCPVCPDGMALYDQLVEAGAVAHKCQLHTCFTEAVSPEVITRLSDDPSVDVTGELRYVHGVEAWVKQINKWLSLPWNEIEVTMGKAWTSLPHLPTAERGRPHYIPATQAELALIIRHFHDAGWHVARDPHNREVLRFGGPESLIGTKRQPKHAREELKLQDEPGPAEEAFVTALRGTEVAQG